MKHKLLCITIIFLFISTAYAEELKAHLSIQQEFMENGHASSISITMSDENIFYSGFSLNYIKSSTNIEHNRKTIFPIYVFVGVKAPWKLSPFIEFGGDLTEALIENVLMRTGSEIDYYYSGGFEYSLNDTFTFSLYAKKYNFIFKKRNSEQISTPRPYSYGVAINMLF